MTTGKCWICDQAIEGHSAAVGRSGERVRYVPFVRDLRSRGAVLAHPVCFATEHGVDALVTVVHERDFEVIDKFGEAGHVERI